MGDRLTLRKSSVWPTVSLILGGGVVFLVGFVSLHSMIRSHVEPPQTPAPRRMGIALAGATAGLNGGTVVQTIRITPESVARAPAASPPEPLAATSPPPPPRRDSRPQPGGAWAMATPPTWLATVDAAAGLGVPAAVDPSAPHADTIPRPQAVGLAAVSALALPLGPLVQASEPGATQVAQIEDVPLPRVRPKPPTRSKAKRRRGRR